MNQSYCISAALHFISISTEPSRVSGERSQLSAHHTSGASLWVLPVQLLWLLGSQGYRPVVLAAGPCAHLTGSALQWECSLALSFLFSSTEVVCRHFPSPPPPPPKSWWSNLKLEEGRQEADKMWALAGNCDPDLQCFRNRSVYGLVGYVCSTVLCKYQRIPLPGLKIVIFVCFSPYLAKKSILRGPAAMLDFEMFFEFWLYYFFRLYFLLC